MIKRPFQVLFLVLICWMNSVSSICAAESIDEKKILVSMRMIGHQLLKSSGDLTSRVLPIEHIEDTYIIQFDTEFTFDSDSLKSIVDRVLFDKRIATDYVVEMENDLTKEISYTYLVTSIGGPGMLPCGGRLQPISKYNLKITFMDPECYSDQIGFATTAIDENKPSAFASIWPYITLLLIPLLMVGGYLFYQRNKKKPVVHNPDVLSIGASKFDKRNMELSIDNRKVELTQKETDLLLLLLSSVNEPLKRENILKSVWGDEGDYIGRTLDVFISKLRKKLESDSTVKIVNIRGVGYKLIVNN